MLKRVITGIGLVTILALSLSAKDFKTPLEMKVCFRYEHNIYNESRKIANCKNIESPYVVSYLQGKNYSYEKRYGSLSISTQKSGAGTDILINKNWANILLNYRKFVCSLDREDIQKLGFFLSFRTTARYRDTTYSKAAKRYLSFLTINEPGLSSIINEDILIEFLWLNKRGIYKNTTDINDFIGYIAAGNYKAAKELVDNSERTKALNGFKKICKLPIKYKE